MSKKIIPLNLTKRDIAKLSKRFLANYGVILSRTHNDGLNYKTSLADGDVLFSIYEYDEKLVGVYLHPSDIDDGRCEVVLKPVDGRFQLEILGGN